MEFTKFVNSVKLMLKNRPEWSRETAFVGLAARETLIDYNPADGTLKIKVGRCTNCGQCCMTLAPDSTIDIHWGTDSEGKCNKLDLQGDKWICTAKYDTPYRCLRDPLKANAPDCDITHYIEVGVFF